MRNEAGIDPVAHSEVRRHARQRCQQEFLQRAEPRVQHRRRHHQTFDAAQALRHQAARHQSAQAVPKQDQGSGGRHPQPRAVDDVGQVVDQAGRRRQQPTPAA